MFTKIFKLASLLLITMVLFSSCDELGGQEGDEKIETFNNNIDKLTAGEWILSDLIVNDTANWYETTPECRKDNVLNFDAADITNSDPENLTAVGQATLSEGEQACNPDNPASYSGKWEYTPNDGIPDNIKSVFVFSGDDYPENGIYYDVLELTETKLVLEGDYNGDKIKETWTKK